MFLGRKSPFEKGAVQILSHTISRRSSFLTTRDRVQLIDAKYAGTWELPAIGTVSAPTAVLIRPDGYVAWVGDSTQLGLADALTTWFGPVSKAAALKA